MLERTLVFVDTSYLLASFYNSWQMGARGQLEIDLREVVSVLGEMVEQHLHQPVQRQQWYDGIPDSGPHRYQRALRSCNGVQLRTGQLIEWGERRTQKAVDTRLVADMVVAAYRGQVSDIVLVSGDADMVPGVEEATNAGVRVHVYGFGWDSMSSVLRHACDSTTILDPREDFADCMQIHVLEGPLPPAVAVNEPEAAEGDATPEETAPADATTPAAAETETAEPTETPEPAADAATSPQETPAAPAAAPETTAPQQEAAPAAAEPPAEEAQPAAAATAEVTEVTVEVTSIEVERKTSFPSPADVARTASTPEELANSVRPAPNPSMMAPRRKLRSRYVPLPSEVWSQGGFQTPFDVGQQYAIWWYQNAATEEQRDDAHLLTGGGLPPEVDRPLLQFACETLHEYTLSEHQRVSLRDGFHSGIRALLSGNMDN